MAFAVQKRITGNLFDAFNISFFFVASLSPLFHWRFPSTKQISCQFLRESWVTGKVRILNSYTCKPSRPYFICLAAYTLINMQMCCNIGGATFEMKFIRITINLILCVMFEMIYLVSIRTCLRFGPVHIHLDVVMMSSLYAATQERMQRTKVSAMVNFNCIKLIPAQNNIYCIWSEVRR